MADPAPGNRPWKEIQMSTLTKMLIAAVAGLLIGGGAFVGAATVDSTDASENVTTESTVGDDVSGPCDEAEHADDPRCDGSQRPEDDDANQAGDDAGEAGDDDIDDDADEDAGDDDGPGNPDHGDDDDVDDNSGPGPNSGPGNADDDDQDDGDSSGPGGGDEDSSGPGSGSEDG
jgi:hypothetical protein